MAWICFATETATREPSPVLLNAVIAIFGGIIGWFLKVLANRMAEKSHFDHRLRLEKEYGLYSDLWDKLFEFRRAFGQHNQFRNSVSSTGSVRHDEHILEWFNAYNKVVDNGEPFMSTTVFDPARKILKIGRTSLATLEHSKNLMRLARQQAQNSL